MANDCRLTDSFLLEDDLFQFQGAVASSLQLSYLGIKVSALHYLQSILYVPADFELITALALAVKTNVANTLDSLIKC